MNNLFFTGKIQVGKSTLLENILERAIGSIGGFKVVHVSGTREENGNPMFKMFSLYDGSKSFNIGNIFDMKKNIEKNTKAFDEIGSNFIEDSINNRDIIVMDEVGVLESKANKFKESIIKALDCEKVVLGVLKEKNDEFLNYIKEREDVIVIEITEENRNELLDYSLDILKLFNIKFKECGILKWDREKLRWYNEALNNPENKYPDVFLDIMKKELGDFKNLKILDIGSGTGVFTFPLGNIGANVTAIDSSFKACEDIIKRNSNENIKCIIGDFRKFDFKEKYDVVICAFCQGAVSLKENIEKLLNLAKKRIYIITYNNKYHKNFKIDELYTRLGRNKKRFNVTSDNVTKAIEECNCQYKIENVKFPFNQYFKTIGEGKKFCYSHFSIHRKNDIEEVDKFLMENIKEYKDGYVFYNTRDSLLYTIKISK